MVQTLITLDEGHDRILNIVKGKFGYKNKNEAIQHIIQEYEENLLEPELKPEYVNKMLKRQSEPTVKVKDFRKYFGLK